MVFTNSGVNFEEPECIFIHPTKNNVLEKLTWVIILSAYDQDEGNRYY